jgi:hypothetical protein
LFALAIVVPAVGVLDYRPRPAEPAPAGEPDPPKQPPHPNAALPVKPYPLTPTERLTAALKRIKANETPEETPAELLALLSNLPKDEKDQFRQAKEAIVEYAVGRLERGVKQAMDREEWLTARATLDAYESDLANLVGFEGVKDRYLPLRSDLDAAVYRDAVNVLRKAADARERLGYLAVPMFASPDWELTPDEVVDLVRVSDIHIRQLNKVLKVYKPLDENWKARFDSLQSHLADPVGIPLSKLPSPDSPATRR